MFDNIGGKIKGIAMTIFAIEMIGVVIGAAALMFTGEFELFLLGLGTLVVGYLVAYLSVILIYAFGELVENSTIIAANTNGMSNSVQNSIVNQSTTSNVGITNHSSVSSNGTTSGLDTQPLFKDEAPSLFKDESHKKIEANPDYWVCKSCGRSNHKTAGTCGCGQRKTI